MIQLLTICVVYVNISQSNISNSYIRIDVFNLFGEKKWSSFILFILFARSDFIDRSFLFLGQLKLLQDSEELTKKYKEMRRLKKEMRRKMKKARRHRHISPRIHCMVTPWSDWSTCSATCGDGFKMKNRMIKVEPKNGGRKCPKKLVKKKSCRIAKCRKQKFKPYFCLFPFFKKLHISSGWNLKIDLFQ